MITGPATIWTDTSLGLDLTGINFKRYGGNTTITTTTINKIQVYKDNVLKQMTNNPQIMHGSTLKNIKEIWVGNTKVFGTTSTTKTSGGVPVHYKYYYNGSWKSAQDIDNVPAVKSYAQYSGDVQYGVYTHTYRPTIYFNGTALSWTDFSSHNGGYQYKYNNYVVAIYNGSANTLNTTLTDTQASMPKKKINIPPYTVAFFNMLNCQSSSSLDSGSGSGSGSGSSLSNCYLTFNISGKTTPVKVTLDFTGVNNYQAT